MSSPRPTEHWKRALERAGSGGPRRHRGNNGQHIPQLRSPFSITPEDGRKGMLKLAGRLLQNIWRSLGMTDKMCSDKTKKTKHFKVQCLALNVTQLQERKIQRWRHHGMGRFLFLWYRRNPNYPMKTYGGNSCEESAAIHYEDDDEDEMWVDFSLGQRSKTFCKGDSQLGRH